ncbi:type II toxin-antitoxin system RelE/ParE family toxin [Sphingobacterium humi]|uniref:type II toxin-antitoxin system RelE/ParE family toxin n=1 Tax=Sphingobacterium humi TaxID=1796905 RepID=UPI0031B5C750
MAKLTLSLLEFRTLYQGVHYRLLAFWDKTSSSKTLVISTHGFIKKRSKVPYDRHFVESFYRIESASKTSN